MTTSTLQQIEDAFRDLDAALDPVLDTVHTPDIQGALVAALAIRLVQYQIGSHVPAGVAERIAVSLAAQLASLKRDIVQESWEN